jgi:7,8-dihydroneopterin aldolase/epimerase/oxygenase
LVPDGLTRLGWSELIAPSQRASGLESAPGDCKIAAAMNPKADAIRIEELEISARVGVPDEERAVAQRLTVSVVLQPQRSFADLGDDLTQTIDYATVCDALQRVASGSAVRLIETLADTMATHLLAHFPLARVELELRKFILRQTKYVSVTVMREPAESAEN